jgi:hypothetical protein
MNSQGVHAWLQCPGYWGVAELVNPETEPEDNQYSWVW